MRLFMSISLSALKRLLQPLGLPLSRISPSERHIFTPRREIKRVFLARFARIYTPTATEMPMLSCVPAAAPAMPRPQTGLMNSQVKATLRPLERMKRKLAARGRPSILQKFIGT